MMAAAMAALALAAAVGLHGLPGIGAHPAAPSPAVAIALAPLPIDLVPGQTHREIARRMVGRDLFIALALGVESSPSRAYVDEAGANVGAGYCVEMRRRALGAAKVRSELSRAGFSPRDVASLMSGDARRIVAVEVGHAQSLRLLAMTKPQYQAMARKAVGRGVFDALPAHRRDVLTYLAYNTGGPEKFVKLIGAVRSGDDRAALAQLAPSVLGARGRVSKNHRLRAWAQAAWMGPPELGRALDKPVAFEVAYAGSGGQDRFIRDHAALLAVHALAPRAFGMSKKAEVGNIAGKLSLRKAGRGGTPAPGGASKPGGPRRGVGPKIGKA